jgi:hypothetical protein
MVVLLAALVILDAQISQAFECGDIDSNGGIGATDALAVLRKGVGLETPAFVCPINCGTSTTVVGAAVAIECGDVDGSGGISATDALMVLRKGVALETPPFVCPVNCGTTTTSVTAGDCFSDFDCGEGNPGDLHCCAYRCAECDQNEHCPSGHHCDGTCTCQPNP